MLELVAAFICLTTLLTYVNFRFIGLPPTIGVLNSTHKCNAHPCMHFVRRLPAQALARA